MSRAHPPASSRLAASLIALLALLLFLAGGEAHALDLELELGLFNRFTLKRNEVERLLLYDVDKQAFASSSYLVPGVNDTYYSFLASASVLVKPRKWLGLGFAVDSGEMRPVGQLPAQTTIELSRLPSEYLGTPTVLTTDYRHSATANGQLVRDEARETAFIRQAYVRLQAPQTEWFVAEVGRLASEVGSGIVYNDFGLGVHLSADLELLRGTPLRFTSRVLLPTRSWTEGLHSPLVELRADYLLSILEAVGLSISYFRDGDHNLGSLLIPVISEAAVRTQPSMDPDLHRDLFALGLSTGMPSRANLAWFTLDGNKYIGDLQLSATFVVEVGHISIDNPFQLVQLLGPKAPSSIPRGPTLEIDTLGFALDASARYLITEKLAIGAFVLYLSGDKNPVLGSTGRYKSFLGVVPYLTQTNLFFSGGMNQTFSGRQATTSGVNGRGVASGGLTALWELRDRLRIGSTAAVLFAQEALASGRFYGQETDLEASWAITKYLRLSAEYDVLWGGNFFPSSAVMHKLLVGFDVTYER